MTETAVIDLAAVAYEASERGAIDALLADVAHELRSRGVRLAGAEQVNAPNAAGPCSEMALEDLASGRVILISQARGAPSEGCRLDSGALEEAAGLALASLHAGVDLVIVNRFSKSELDSGGMRQVIEAVVSAGTPVIVGLNVTYRAAWDGFTGGATVWLPQDEAAIIHWSLEAIGKRATVLPDARSPSAALRDRRG